MVKNEYKGIKVSDSTYENIENVRKLMMQKGLGALSDDIVKYMPKECPACHTEMDLVQLGVEHAECPNCHFSYNKLQLGVGGGFAIGALVGLGIAGLIYLLTKK